MPQLLATQVSISHRGFRSWSLFTRGRCARLYADGGWTLLLVALPTGFRLRRGAADRRVPGKGARAEPSCSAVVGSTGSGDIVPNHVISATDVPQEWAGPRQSAASALEMVSGGSASRADGYLAGLGLTAYNETGAVSGVPLPARPRRGRRSLARAGVHAHHEGGRGATTKPDDLPRGFTDLVGGESGGKNCGGITLEGLPAGRRLTWPPKRGIIVADTKLESSAGAEGRPRSFLADEVAQLLTHPASGLPTSYSPGPPRSTPSTSSNLRDWVDVDRLGPAPEPGTGDSPPTSSGVLTARYSELFEEDHRTPCRWH